MEDAPFAKAAREAAQIALHQIGRDGDLELIRVGSAAVLATPALVLRVTRDVPVSEIAGQLRLASYLDRCGIAVVRPAHPTAVQTATGVLATVWEREPVLDSRPAPFEHGRALALLHACPVPDWLPALDPLAQTERRVNQLFGQGVALEQMSVLTKGLGRAQRLWARAAYPQAVVVHGDITGNLLQTPRGPVLCDFENAGVGNGAFDLARVIHASSRFDWPAEDRQAALDGYLAAGGALRNIVQGEQLAQMIDVIGASWALLGACRDPNRFAAQAAVRLQTVATEGRSSGWRPL